MPEYNAKIHTVGPSGQIDLLHKFSGWSRTWQHIIVIKRTLQPSNLLFYDRIAGLGRIYRLNVDGTVDLLKEYTGWSKTWDIIVPLGLVDTLGLLFYDRRAGRARFYTVDTSGDLSFVCEHTTWRKSWDNIINVTASFNGKYPGLLLYDRAAGEAKLFTVDVGKGQITLVRHHTGWKKTWDIIVHGNFGSGNDLLLYRRVAGAARVLALDDAGNLKASKKIQFHKTWDIIVPGSFVSGSPRTELLCYDRVAGRGEFMKVNSSGDFVTTLTHTGWGTHWSTILPIRVDSGNTRTDLLFYSNSLHVNLHVVKCANTDGKRDTETTPQQVQMWVDHANKVFGQAGVIFDFDPTTGFESVKNTALNSVVKNEPGDTPDIAKVKALNYKLAEAYADQFPDKAMVLIRYGLEKSPGNPSGPLGDGMSGPEHKFVLMPGFDFTKADVYYEDGTMKPGMQAIKLLGHELGHYCGLHHTFAKVLWTDENDKIVDPDQALIAYLKAKGSTSASAFDLDSSTISDTPPDVRGGYFTLKDWNPADTTKEVTVKSPADGIDINFSPDRHNLMSRFTCDDYDRLSPDQARLIREWLVVHRSELLGGQI